MLVFSSCEEVVIIDLPDAQNLVTVEGWLTNFDEIQTIRLTRSNSFASNQPVTPITNAIVSVQSKKNGNSFLYLHGSNGFYKSTQSFGGETGEEYQVRIDLSEGLSIRSQWERMVETVPIDALFIDSFVENDPDNANRQFTVFFPRISAVDPANNRNFYRWMFLINSQFYDEPESITIQDDRFFDGNVIPNNFRSFGYETGDEMIVQFQSINQEAYDYLSLLKSQITSLGTSTGTTPAFVQGNLSYFSSENDQSVLGYFGTVAISSDTAIVE